MPLLPHDDVCGFGKGVEPFALPNDLTAGNLDHLTTTSEQIKNILYRTSARMAPSMPSRLRGNMRPPKMRRRMPIDCV